MRWICTRTRPHVTSSKEPVLLVDDDSSILEVLRAALRPRFALETAPGPHEGLRCLREHGPFAVVVSDFSMPEMNGLEFLREVHRLDPDVVGLILSGNGHVDTGRTSDEPGIFCWLHKPVAPSTLANAIDEALQFSRRRKQRPDGA